MTWGIICQTTLAKFFTAGLGLLLPIVDLLCVWGTHSRIMTRRNIRQTSAAGLKTRTAIGLCRRRAPMHILRGQTYKEYEPGYFTLDASGNLGGEGRGLPIPQRSLAATLEYSPGYFPGEASGDVGGGGRDAPIQPWSLPL